MELDGHYSSAAYEQLLDETRRLFGDLPMVHFRTNYRTTFVYTDPDGDKVRVSSTSDLREARRLFPKYIVIVATVTPRRHPDAIDVSLTMATASTPSIEAALNLVCDLSGQFQLLADQNCTLSSQVNYLAGQVLALSNQVPALPPSTSRRSSSGSTVSAAAAPGRWAARGSGSRS